MANTTVLVLSDSHGSPKRIAEALDRVREVDNLSPDILIFCGDGLDDLDSPAVQSALSHGKSPVIYAVRGNCDRFNTREETLTVSVGGVRLFICHGHTLGVKSGILRAVCAARQADADILVFGHTHEACDILLTPENPRGIDGLTRPLRLFNPGAIDAYPFSFGIVTVRDGQALTSVGTLL